MAKASKRIPKKPTGGPLDASLSEPRYLDSFRCKQFYTIEDLELHRLGKKKEIYFLGENGDGKTLLLQSILIALKWDDIIERFDVEATGAVLDLLYNTTAKLTAKDVNGNKYHYIPNESMIDHMPFLTSNTRNNPVFAYGVYRGKSSDLGDVYGFMTLFDSKQTRQPKMLRDPIAWLKYLYSIELEKRLDKNFPASGPSLNSVIQMMENILGKDVQIKVDVHRVTFAEGGSQLEYYQLSEGFRSALTWLLDLLQGLATYQPQATAIENYYGIVLVDEISLHLHPRWELTFVRQLRKWFPNIQFILTTHSPITIMGSSEDAVYYRLYKENGKTCISEPYEHKTIKQLLANAIITSPLFGLDDAAMALHGKNIDTSRSYIEAQIYTAVKKRMETGNKPYYSPEEIEQFVEEAFKDREK